MEAAGPASEVVVPQGLHAVRIPLGHPPVVISVPGSRDLLAKVCGHLTWKPGECTFETSDNGQISIKLETSVANRDVFVVCARDDAESEVNFSIMRLLLLIDALRRDSPYRVTVILPSLEYARQDRRLVAGEAIPPKLLLRLMRTSGADRFIVMDLHNDAEAAFSPTGAVLDEISADKYLAHFIRTEVPGFNPDRVLVCATNGGGMKFTRRMADELRTGLIMADRFRSKAMGPGEIKIIAEARSEGVDSIVIVDDMFDTCGSLAAVCGALMAFAPQAKLYAVATHGYFSGDAHLKIKKLVESCGLEWLAVTNSINQAGAVQRCSSVGLRDRLRVVDISRLIAGSIIRVYLGDSVSLPRFRSLCPSNEDPVLKEAPLVPQHQYTHITGVAEAQPRAVMWD
mmetsp:Transcript_32044/g.91384  ORF Transcript_32044/g.91384 Transcript_32044/m.91384 type:complete len:399 (-) Transcript_32044:64-1260(-)